MKDSSEIFQKQRQFFESGATKDVKFRKQQLNKLLLFIQTNEKRIAEALWADLHKGGFESYTTETGICIHELKYLIRKINRFAKPKKVSTPIMHFKAKSLIYSDPYGQNLIIAPWNYPFQLIVAPLAGAIAAGNTVIVKPSEMSKEVEKLVKEMIEELFDEEYIACVIGGVKESQELLKLAFDHIFFTGSPKVGKHVMEAASKNLTPVTLELGGKSPVIVDETANIDLAARKICWGKFLNCGQTCIAPDYLLAHHSVKEKLVERIIFYIKRFYGENIENNPDYPRIINIANTLRLKGLLKGCEIISGGTIVEDELYISPTLVNEPANDSPIMSEEIFGPLLPILSYTKLDEVVNRVNAGPKPLSMYVFSNSKKNQKYLLNSITAGNGAVNDVILQYANANLPFGGVGNSGIGSYHGKQSFFAFSHQKSILKRSNIIDLPMRYPPYNDSKLKMIKRFLG